MQTLEPYYARQIVEGLDLKASLLQLAQKLIDLLDSQNQANVADIHAALFPLSRPNSANAQLNRLIAELEQKAQAKNAALKVKITKNKKGGPKNRWVWFEGAPEAPILPYAGELKAIEASELIIDQRGLPTEEIPTIILITFNEHETSAVVKHFHPDGMPKTKTVDGISYNLLGIRGEMRIVHRVSKQGQAEAQKAAQDAISGWHPKAIIGVGIAFGVNSKKQKIGDVLVSESVRDYEFGRVDPGGTITPRGNKPPASDLLYQRFDHLNQTLCSQPNASASWPKVRFGTLLSGNKLVDNLDYRASLLQIETEAIGGEMEGSGIFIAAQRHKTDWIIVKAICDWADGNKNNPSKEKDQITAAEHAALVVKAALELGNLYPGGVLFPGGGFSKPGEAKATLNHIPTIDCMNLMDHANVQCMIKDVKASQASLKKELAFKADVESDKEGVDVMDYLFKWVNDAKAPPLFCLLGEYGMGKTITTQRLAKSLADQREQNPLLPMPLYFDLRHVTGLDKSVPTLKAAIEECMERGWHHFPMAIRYNLNDVYGWMAQGAVVILDGLDEVLVKLKEADGQVFTNSLLKLGADLRMQAAKARQNAAPVKILISCRTQYFRTLRDQQNHFTGQERGEHGAERYRALVLLPLNEKQIKAYLENALPGSNPHCIYETLASVHNLKELAHRPYTLRLVADLIPDIERERLNGKTIYGVTLYRHMVLRWLERDSGKHHIKMDHKLRLAAHLAAHFWRSGGGRLPATDLESWFHAWLESQPDLHRRYRTLHPDQLEEDLRTATFLAREDSDKGSSFRFAHTSLLEYFLSEYLLEALQASIPERWAVPLPSNETLSFLAQLLAEANDPGLIRTMQGWCPQYQNRTSELVLAYALHARRVGWPAPSLVGMDLSGADLSGWRIDGRASLNQGDVGQLDLRQTTFSGTNLQNAVFDCVNLSHAKFCGANITQTNFLSCDATESDWQGVKCTAAIFRSTELKGACWSNAAGYRPQFLLCEGGIDSQNVNAGMKVQSPQTAPDPALSDIRLIGDLRFIFLSGHSSSVSSCLFSPDGSRIVSAGRDGTLRIWDAQDGQVLMTITGHQGLIESCVFSPDGSHIASAGSDGTLRVWDARSGQAVMTINGHEGWIESCVFSPGGNHIASAGSDGTLRVWDAQNGQALMTMTGHEGVVESCVYSPGGSRLASAGRDGTLRVWDAQNGQALMTMTGHEGVVESCAYSPDGRCIASAGWNRTLLLWDAQSGQALLTMTGYSGVVESCAYSPDGRNIVSVGWDGALRVWDAQSGEALMTMIGRQGLIESCFYSPDGSRLASAGSDGTLRVWDAQSGQALMTMTGHEGVVESCAYSPDGSRLASAGSDGTLHLWDAQSGQALMTMTGHEGGVESCAFSPDGSRLASVGWDGVRLWDAQSGQFLQIIAGNRLFMSCAYSPEGNRLALAGLDGKLRLWDAQTGQALVTMTGHIGWVQDCVFSPDGRHLASAGWDGTLRIWDAQTGQLRRTHFLTASRSTESGHAVWDVEGNCLIEACGDIWRTLAWVRPGPDGWPERLPIETFGPLPTPKRLASAAINKPKNP